MRTCELLLTTTKGQVVGGKIMLHDDGTITVEHAPGHEVLMANAMRRPHFVDGGLKKIEREEDPRAWFESLPLHYSGSMLRARMVGREP